MKTFLRNLLFGVVPVTEYSTITIEGGINERVYLRVEEKNIDISATHWLLCLDPIVFGIWFSKEGDVVSFNKVAVYKMYFADSETGTNVVAALKLKFFDKIEGPDGTLVLLSLSDVRIYHVNFFRTWLLFYKYYKKPEQDFHKLKSYSAAYSYPRRVRLVSFRDENWFNIFPMDLVGDVPFSGRYVFGLRHSNVTLSRIIKDGKIAVSEIPYEYKNIIYQLGKHHRKAMSDSSLPFGLIKSEFFDFPIPEWADSYKEIRIVDNMNLGSHMLLWGEEINQKSIRGPHGNLFHIHFLHYTHLRRRGMAYPLV